MTHPTDDPLRAALERLQSSIQAALAAAPQPAPEQGMTRAEVGQMLDAKRHDREALVEVIARQLPRSLGNGYEEANNIADALLARGLRLTGEDN